MKALLKISLAANLALGAGVIFFVARNAQRELETESTAVSQTSAPAPPPTPFHWRQLESTDYRIYIANLRGIGCPEQTLRDIITADVDSQYAPRRRELQNRALSKSALESGLRTLEHEEVALLDNLLGIRLIDATAQSANPTAPSVHARWKSPVEEYIATPLALQNVDPAALKLTGEQAETLAEIQEHFIAAIGGPNQDPNDPAYRKRWQKAQPECDDMLRGMLGTQVWLELEQDAADQNPLVQ